VNIGAGCHSRSDALAAIETRLVTDAVLNGGGQPYYSKQRALPCAGSGIEDHMSVSGDAATKNDVWSRSTVVPAESAGSRPRSAGPDLLRAIAILLVMLWHVPRPARLEALDGLRTFSWTGVDLFFVLSGFLIGTQLLTPIARDQRPSLREFYLKRSFRILPAFLFVLALYKLVPVLSDGDALQPTWRFLTFTMNFGLDFRVTDAFTHAWSLCVEEHFYLILPALALVLSRLRWRGWTLLIAGLLICGGVILRALLWRSLGEAAAADANFAFVPEYMKAIYYPTYCRLDGLVFGVLLAAYRCFHPEHWKRYADPRLTLCLGVTCIVLAGSLFYFPPEPFVGGPGLSFVGAVVGYPLFSLGCALLLSASLNWERLFPTWQVPGAAMIATISFSLYLSHKMTNQAVHSWLSPESLSGVQGLLIYYASGITGGALLWWLVERPFLRLRDRLLRKKKLVEREGIEPSTPAL
jgi:peptidoglycan/LPS O-acetylase OafA/YrhL